MPPSPPPSSSSSSPPRPSALQAPNDRSTRPLIIGDESGPSSPPFPIYLSGSVQRGFGRGGKELGCPTANLPSRLLQPGGQGGGLSEAPTGIYFGYGRVLSREEGGKGEEYEDREQKDAAASKSGSTEVATASTKDLSEEETRVHPMVMSLGWNPFYDNKTKTAVGSIRGGHRWSDETLTMAHLSISFSLRKST